MRQWIDLSRIIDEFVNKVLAAIFHLLEQTNAKHTIFSLRYRLKY